MIKASAFIATSVDGFIARPNGDIDWLPAGGGEEHGYDAFMATVDALLLGRKTFETVLGFGGWSYGSMPVFVLTHRALGLAHPEDSVLEPVSGSPEEVLALLSDRGIQHVYVDGGITIQQFLRAGLIQRMIITRIPVLIGEGIPLFGILTHDVRLEHIATRTYASGLVQSEYTVLG